MSIRPELFRELAHARHLPHEEKDWEVWQKAYETVEDLLAALEEEEFGGEDPALVFLPGGPTPGCGAPVGLDAEPPTVQGEIPDLSLTAAVSLIRRGELSPVELVRAVLDRIAECGGVINAYIACDAEEALRVARRAEDAVAHGRPLGSLHGVPVAVKDFFFTTDLPTTAGTRILTDSIPREDATVIRRLKEAGAIILGKLNLHELAYGITSDNPHFGPVRNPWDLTRISGGSSGGSAGAVAASLCLASLGTDTGGSIRIPASCCGVVGLKPTYARVSRNGVFPLAWSLDHVGPITKTVEDAAVLLRVLAGSDPQDPAASLLPVPDYCRALGIELKGVKIGITRDFFFDPMEIDPGVMAAAQDGLHVMQAAGATVQEVSIPFLGHAAAIQFLTISSEATANHNRLLRTRGRELGEDVRRRLELGEFVTAAQYVRAQQARRHLVQDFAAAFRQVDLLVTPTLPVVAPPIGDHSVRVRGVQKRLQPTLTRFTSPFNLTGLPAISVPCMSGSNGLPVGLQIVGRPFDEATVLRAAFAYQQATPWHTRRPPLRN